MPKSLGGVPVHALHAHCPFTIVQGVSIALSLDANKAALPQLRRRVSLPQHHNRTCAVMFSSSVIPASLLQLLKQPTADNKQILDN